MFSDYIYIFLIMAARIAATKVMRACISKLVVKFH